MAAFIPISLYFSLPGLLLGFLAQFIIRSAWNKYSKVSSEIGVPGAQVARYILDSSGLGHVEVEETRGFLTDHYDPSKKTLRLSKQVYQGNSAAAIGVAAHEAGHALQDSENYRPLTLRSGMIPSVKLGSWLGPIFFPSVLPFPPLGGRFWQCLA
jgi:Zn-dependent membrane protease YugP